MRWWAFGRRFGNLEFETENAGWIDRVEDNQWSDISINSGLLFVEEVHDYQCRSTWHLMMMNLFTVWWSIFEGWSKSFRFPCEIVNTGGSVLYHCKDMLSNSIVHVTCRRTCNRQIGGKCVFSSVVGKTEVCCVIKLLHPQGKANSWWDVCGVNTLRRTIKPISMWMSWLLQWL